MVRLKKATLSCRGWRTVRIALATLFRTQSRNWAVGPKDGGNQLRKLATANNAVEYRRIQRRKDLEAQRAIGEALFGGFSDEIEDLTPDERDASPATLFSTRPCVPGAQQSGSRATIWASATTRSAGRRRTASTSGSATRAPPWTARSVSSMARILPTF